jgi:hypothetical protein
MPSEAISTVYIILQFSLLLFISDSNYSKRKLGEKFFPPLLVILCNLVRSQVKMSPSVPAFVPTYSSKVMLILKDVPDFTRGTELWKDLEIYFISQFLCGYLPDNHGAKLQ